MKNEYVIISSDDNILYLEFLELITKQWLYKIGIPVVFAHIGEEESELISTEYGFLKKFKKIEGIPSGFLAQIVRLYMFKVLPQFTILLSDIDMLPLSKSYFTEKDVEAGKILLYTDNAYSNVPYYPICYVAANGKLMTEVLQLDDSFEAFARRLWQLYDGAWNSDEHFLFDMLSKKEELLIKLKRDIQSTRICRSNWNYDAARLRNGEYIDSHLPRPYNVNKEKIEKIL